MGKRRGRGVGRHCNGGKRGMNGEEWKDGVWERRTDGELRMKEVGA